MFNLQDFTNFLNQNQYLSRSTYNDMKNRFNDSLFRERIQFQLLNSPLFNENINYFNNGSGQISDDVNYDREIRSAMEASFDDLGGNINNDDDDMKRALELSMMDAPKKEETVPQVNTNDMDEETQLALKMSLLSTSALENEEPVNEEDELTKAIELSLSGNERIVRLNQIKEQDDLYQESLRRDKEKERLKEEEFMKQERESLETAFNISKKEDLLRKREKLLREIVIPEEPPKGPNIVDIKFVLPSGENLRRRFNIKQPFADLKDFIDTRHLSENGSLIIPEDYIFVTDFPRKEYRDFYQTLEGAGITRSEILKIHDLL